MTAAVVIEGLVILLLAILVAGLLRSHAEILRQLAALGAGEDGALAPRARPTPAAPGGERAPTTTLTGTDPSGAGVTISLEHGRGHTLIAFLSSGCMSCVTFWETLRGDFEPPTPDTRTVVVTKGPQSESPSRIGELAPERLPLIMSDEMWETFRVPMTPYFLLVDGAGSVVGEGAAADWRHLLGMLRRSAADVPVHLDTEGRMSLADDSLRRAGIEPGDPSLHQDPLDGE